MQLTYQTIKNSTETRPALVVIGLIALGVLLAALFQALIIDLFYPNSAMNLLIAVTLLAITLIRFTYRGQRASAILLRGTCCCLGTYVALLWPGFPIEENANANSFLTFGRWIALSAAIGALFRPSFAIVPATYIVLHKMLAESMTGVQISITDYQPIVDTCFVLSFGLLVINWAKSRWQFTHDASAALFLVCVAIHFGNYFWSGIAKLSLDGGVLNWLVENKTSNLILAANELGSLPLTTSQGAFMYTLMSNMDLAINAFTLLTQLLTIACITSIRRTIILTIILDLSHIAIYMLTGILFWKWMLLNLAIVIGAKTLSNLKIHFAPAIALIAIVPLADTLFFSAKLGWYDTKALVNPKFYAVDSQGKQHRVPSNFFLATSVTAAQQRLGQPFGISMGAHTFGNSVSNAIRIQAEQSCSTLAKQEDNWKNPELDQYIARHHYHMLRMADHHGRVRYNHYPHHILSNPTNDGSLRNLNLKDISHYNLVVEGVCLSYSDGKFQRKVVASDNYQIQLPGTGSNTNNPSSHE